MVPRCHVATILKCMLQSNQSRNVYSLGMRQKLVERVLVVIQTCHGHQETLNDLPGLSSVVWLSVGTLQTI